MAARRSRRSGLVRPQRVANNLSIGSVNSDKLSGGKPVHLVVLRPICAHVKPKGQQRRGLEAYLPTSGSLRERRAAALLANQKTPTFCRRRRSRTLVPVMAGRLPALSLALQPPRNSPNLQERAWRDQARPGWRPEPIPAGPDNGCRRAAGNRVDWMPSFYSFGRRATGPTAVPSSAPR
jgi:hypothetical protein